MRALGAHSALSRHVGLHHHLRADRAPSSDRTAPLPLDGPRGQTGMLEN